MELDWLSAVGDGPNGAVDLQGSVLSSSTSKTAEVEVPPRCGGEDSVAEAEVEVPDAAAAGSIAAAAIASATESSRPFSRAPASASISSLAIRVNPSSTCGVRSVKP